MRGHSSIWELYLKGGFQELMPGKDSVPDIVGAVEKQTRSIDSLFDCDVSRLDAAVDNAKTLIGEGFSASNAASKMDYGTYTDSLWKEYIPIKYAESTITRLENKRIADRYFYGHAIRVLKALDNLENALPDIIDREYSSFQKRQEDLAKRDISIDVNSGQDMLNITTKNILSLIGLFNDRDMDTKKIDIQDIMRVIEPYREKIPRMKDSDQRIDTLIEKYRGLEYDKNTKKSIKKLRRPISRRFGLFKGYILRECSNIGYIAGIDRCKRLSEELRYAKDDFATMIGKKNHLESMISHLASLSSDASSYSIPMSLTQVKSIVRIDLTDGKDVHPSGLIYLEKHEQTYSGLIGATKDKIQAMIAEQRSYIQNLHEILSKDTKRKVSDSRGYENLLAHMDSDRRHLEEYLPQMELLGMNMAYTKKLFAQCDALKKRSIKDGGSLYLDSKPLPPILVNSSALVDQVRMIAPPDDMRLAVIDDIIRGQRYPGGWVERLNGLSKEVDKLKTYKNLSRTDYVLKVAELIDDSYKNGYFGDIAGIKENRSVVESSINNIYSLGRILARA